MKNNTTSRSFLQRPLGSNLLQQFRMRFRKDGGFTWQQLQQLKRPDPLKNPEGVKQWSRNLRRQIEDSGRRANQMCNLSQGLDPMSVVVRVDELLAAEEELMLLSALEELCKQHRQLRITYVTHRSDLVNAVSSRWFIHCAQLYDPETYTDLFSEEAFELVAETPNPEASILEEERRYKVRHDQLTVLHQKMLERIEKEGAKDVKPEPAPEYAFRSNWHQSQAWLWQVAEQLGLEVNVPEDAIHPFGDIPTFWREVVSKDFSKEGLTARPFIVTDFSSEPEPAELVQVIQTQLPGVTILPAQRLMDLAKQHYPGQENVDGWNLVELITLLGQGNCWGVVGPVGTVTYAAWAAIQGLLLFQVIPKESLPLLIQFYTGNNPRWDGVATPQAITVNRTQYQTAQMPQVLSEALAVATQGHHYIRTKENRSG